LALGFWKFGHLKFGNLDCKFGKLRMCHFFSEIFCF
jgi:hypothetical protein